MHISLLLVYSIVFDMIYVGSAIATTIEIYKCTDWNISSFCFGFSRKENRTAAVCLPFLYDCFQTCEFNLFTKPGRSDMEPINEHLCSSKNEMTFFLLSFVSCFCLKKQNHFIQFPIKEKKVLIFICTVSMVPYFGIFDFLVNNATILFDSNFFFFPPIFGNSKINYLESGIFN